MHSPANQAHIRVIANPLNPSTSRKIVSGVEAPQDQATCEQFKAFSKFSSILTHAHSCKLIVQTLFASIALISFWLFCKHSNLTSRKDQGLATFE